MMLELFFNKSQATGRTVMKLFEFEANILTTRQQRILSSPKQDGNCFEDSLPYLKDLDIEILNSRQSIQFTPNINERIHRWAPYVQGFSASFVQSIFNAYGKDYNSPKILDPFSGCGTVPVQAKLNGFESFGTELNPLLHFTSTTKVNSWNTDPKELLDSFDNLPKDLIEEAPKFLKSNNQFNSDVLRNLERIKGGISVYKENRNIYNLLQLAFSSILIECSNLKRSPCLGYVKNKKIMAAKPYILLKQKVHQIANDLLFIQNECKKQINCNSEIFLGNAMTFKHQDEFDLVITSPPYMNGLDYVMNYKIEMGWLSFANNQKELKKVKDEMVVCDNVSKGLIRDSKPTYTNVWIEKIKDDIINNINRRGAYRRPDMPFIVHKYFDDMYKVMDNVIAAMNKNGRFILVVGDSLIADVYIPTDLLIAKIGKDLGLTIEKVEKARERRSGQIRSYKLRETIITLKKNG
jgi:16S rRNA G966 N2-methylase RsmD